MDAFFVALGVVPTVNLIRVVLPVKTNYAGNSVLALIVTVAGSFLMGVTDPLRMTAAFGLSHVIQRSTRWLEASGDAARVQTVRAARRSIV